ncbi:hypothetical protein ACU80G_29520 (plasmid) [Bacillus mycoides]
MNKITLHYPKGDLTIIAFLFIKLFNIRMTSKTLVKIAVIPTIYPEVVI